MKKKVTEFDRLLYLFQTNPNFRPDYDGLLNDISNQLDTSKIKNNNDKIKRSKKMKILLTGCMGFIGSNVLEYLSKNKEYELHGVDDLSAKTKCNVHRNNQYLKVFNQDDYSELDKEYLSEFDVIIHLAARRAVVGSMKKQKDYWVNNVIKQQKFLDKLSPHTKLIFASSSSIYGNAKEYPVTEDMLPNPTSVYGQTKVIGEYQMRCLHNQKGNPTVSLRLFNCVGNYIDAKSNYPLVIPIFAQQMIKNKPITIYGDCSRDFTHVEDVCTAIELCIKTEPRNLVGQVYNVCNSKPISITMLAGCLIDKYKSKSELIHEKQRSYEPKWTFGNNKLIEKELKWVPKKDILQWIEKEEIKINNLR